MRPISAYLFQRAKQAEMSISAIIDGEGMLKTQSNVQSMPNLEIIFEQRAIPNRRITASYFNA